MLILGKNDLISRAEAFAVEAHASIGQVRRYTKEPYVVHCYEVVDLLTTVTDDPEEIATGFLHDVVEDVKIRYDVLKNLFGVRVADMVMEVTDVSDLTDGNRAKRKEMDRLHLARASFGAKRVKLADGISNTRDIAEHDPKFAKIYFPEKRALLPVLVGASDVLWNELNSLVEAYFASTSE